MNFDYDDWLANEPDYYVQEDAIDEQDAYDRWVDSQLEAG